MTIEPTSTTTAHHYWDSHWQTEKGRKGWSIPDPEVTRCLERIRSAGMRRVLDLGSGAGRHALLMAGMGFETTALDASRSGLNYLAGEAASQGLKVSTVNGHMGSLPFAEGAFDYVLALNVIYHGDELAVRRAIREIRRVLRPGGVFQGTLLSKRHDDYGLGREISRNTFVQERAPASDRDHPHHYCNRADVAALLEGFRLTRLVEIEQKRAGRWHWYFEAERI